MMILDQKREVNDWRALCKFCIFFCGSRIHFIFIFYFFRIGGHFRRKAVAKDWHANGGTLSIVGDLEMFQASEYDITNVEVDLKGLVKNSGYHVHVVSLHIINIVFQTVNK